MRLVFARGWGSIEVTNLSDYSKWVWSGMPKVIENDELAISKNELGVLLPLFVGGGRDNLRQ